MASTPRAAIDRRRLGRRLTDVADASVRDVLAARAGGRPHSGSDVHRIAVTGPPGAGKSSLVGAIAAHRLGSARHLGVLAIDPTSPHSGGSILGDRIRIDGVVTDERLYVRSVPSRSSADGTTDNLPDLLAALEEQRFDEILVETVGVGQADYTVRQCVDTVVVIVLPGSGDTVQAMKAGILEVGHVYAVHKADRPGADLLAVELAATLDRRALNGWIPPVLLTSTVSGAGVPQLSDAIDAHRSHLRSRRDAGACTLARARYDVERLVTRRARELVADLTPDALRQPLRDVYHAVVHELLGELAVPHTTTNSEGQRDGDCSTP